MSLRIHSRKTGGASFVSHYHKLLVRLRLASATGAACCLLCQLPAMADSAISTWSIPAYSHRYLDGVTLDTDVAMTSGSMLSVSNGLTLRGRSISLAGESASARLYFDGPQSLGGDGEIVFNGSLGGSIFPSDGTLIIGPGITIRSNTAGGTLGDDRFGLINRGTISAQAAGERLWIGGKNWINEGTLEARNGGILLLGGTLHNLGRTLTLNNDGGLFDFGGAVIGGTIAGNIDLSASGSGLGQWRGVSLAGDMTMRDSSLLTIVGGLTLRDRTIRMAGGAIGSRLLFDGSQTLGGSGEVVFDGTSDRNELRPTSDPNLNVTLTLGKNITVRTGAAGGVVGDSGLALVNEGTILAQTPGRKLTVNALDWRNEGTIKAVDGGSLDLVVKRTGLNQGTLAVSNLVNHGTFTQAAGDADVGVLSGYGSTVVEDDQRLSASSIRQTTLTIGENARVVIRPGAASASVSRIGSLLLEQDAEFDLTNNILVVKATAGTRTSVLQDVQAWVASARNSDQGLWQGPGLTTSLGGNLTGLAVLLNDAGGGRKLLPTEDLNAVLVGYTWSGDLNFDKAINSLDYFVMDQAFMRGEAGLYANGDLNLDGVLNALDYFLIDSAFLAQGSTLGAGTLWASSVPEPSLPMVLSAAAMLWAGRRRRSASVQPVF